jgi:hypothetical protein
MSSFGPEADLLHDGHECRISRLVRRTFKYAGLVVDMKADPFAVVIRATCDREKIDNKTVKEQGFEVRGQIQEGDAAQDVHQKSGWDQRMRRPVRPSAWGTQ